MIFAFFVLSRKKSTQRHRGHREILLPVKKLKNETPTYNY
jgi:hypothetical protein